MRVSLQTTLFLLVLIASVTTCRLAMADWVTASAAYDRGDYETAFVEFKVLAEQGNASAQYNLGDMYAYGWGVPKDTGEAVKWFRLAAEQRYAPAQSVLGGMYRRGYGVIPKDTDEAVKWFRLAAEQGHASSQYMLGIMYFYGWGVPIDDVQAYAWINLAEAQGDEHAKRNKPRLEDEMTPSQIAEAQQLSKELYEKIPH